MLVVVVRANFHAKPKKEKKTNSKVLTFVKDCNQWLYSSKIRVIEIETLKWYIIFHHYTTCLLLPYYRFIMHPSPVSRSSTPLISKCYVSAVCGFSIEQCTFLGAKTDHPVLLHHEFVLRDLVTVRLTRVTSNSSSPNCEKFPRRYPIRHIAM